MTSPRTLDRTLRERRRILRLLDYLKRDDLTGEQMERIGRRLQKSGKRALSPLVRKLWREKNGTAIYRYACMLDFFDVSVWIDQLVQITLKRTDLEEDGKLALLDLLHDSGIDVTAPPFASLTGYGSSSLEGFVDDCLKDGERGLVRFIDSFLDVADEFREKMIRHLAQVASVDAVILLEILLSFERPDVVRQAVEALGRVERGWALDVLTRAEGCHEGETLALIRRSKRRLSFLGVREQVELPRPYAVPLPFHEVLAGPIDFYGARSLWFSWRLEGESFAALLLLTGEADGVLNAISYRMRDPREYGHVLKDVSTSELLLPVDPAYAMACLRDALHRSREQEFYLPPDFYVDMRLFKPDSLKPEAYVPRFCVTHLDGIVEKIPSLISSSSELLDNPALEGWILSEPVVYDAAERFAALEGEGGGGDIDSVALDGEITRFCEELIAPRRAEIIKRLLLTADYLQQIGDDDAAVQATLAMGLSLVGGFLPECRHPFIRRLVLDSIDTARQAMSEGYDPRFEEGFDDDER